MEKKKGEDYGEAEYGNKSGRVNGLNRNTRKVLSGHRKVPAFLHVPLIKNPAFIFDCLPLSVTKAVRVVLLFLPCLQETGWRLETAVTANRREKHTVKCHVCPQKTLNALERRMTTRRKFAHQKRD